MLRYVAYGHILPLRLSPKKTEGTADVRTQGFRGFGLPRGQDEPEYSVLIPSTRHKPLWFMVHLDPCVWRFAVGRRDETAQHRASSPRCSYTFIVLVSCFGMGVQNFYLLLHELSEWLLKSRSYYWVWCDVPLVSYLTSQKYNIPFRLETQLGVKVYEHRVNYM